MNKPPAVALLVIVACLALAPAESGAQTAPLDICGCAGDPTLKPFSTLDPTTYPAGSTSEFRLLIIPLPPDGVFRFSRFHLQPRPSDSSFLDIMFRRNAANTPITILVAGDVAIHPNVRIQIEGFQGQASSSVVNKGALGGPGGFPGGDAAFRVVNLASDGGEGVGPGGGAAGRASPLSSGGSATFVGTRDLLPLVGGSGGGGGASTTTSTSCTGGAGGGGGGAIMIAANGHFILDGTINANGGASSFFGPSCSTAGGAGSGGAVRILADTIRGNTSGSITATGGSAVSGAGGPGVIRLEAFNNTLLVTQTSPVASRAPAPGPLVNPLEPTVAVTAVGGQAVSATPQAFLGGTDVVIAAPGPTRIDLATSGVPTGTTLAVSVKPRVGGAAIRTNATLANCDTEAKCLADVTVDLAAGAYVVEARATYQPPTP